MEFFDVNAFIGRPMLRQHGPAATVDEYFAVVAPLGVTRAVLWHVVQRDVGPDPGNALMSKAIAGDARVRGCWAVLPPQTDRAVMDNLFARMQADNIAALRLFPDMHRYVPDRITLGAVLDEATARNVPVFLSLRFGFDWAGVHRFLTEFPDLPCVLCDVGVWGQDRNSWPVLERFPKTWLDTSMVCLEAGGLEAAVRAYGAERLLFGTGFPYHSPHAAVLDLLHADISEAERAAIAAGNLEKLLSRMTG